MATGGARKRTATSLRTLTDEEWKTFRDTYEAYKFLWDESDPGYKDESARECLYNLFSLKMHESVSDIKKRIKSVRTAFSQAKIAYLNDEVLEGKPKKWFEDYFFLYPYTAIRQLDDMRKPKEAYYPVDETTETEGRNYAVTPVTSPLTSPMPSIIGSPPVSPVKKKFKKPHMYVHPACAQLQDLDTSEVFKEERRGIIPQYENRIRTGQEFKVPPVALEREVTHKSRLGETIQKPIKRVSWLRSYPVEEAWNTDGFWTYNMADKFYMQMSDKEKPLKWKVLPKEKVKSTWYMRLDGPCISHFTELVSHTWDNVDKTKMIVGDHAMLPLSETFTRFNIDTPQAQDPSENLYVEYYFEDESVFVRNKNVRFPMIPKEELKFTNVARMVFDGSLKISTSEYHVEYHFATIRYPIQLELPEPIVIPRSRRADKIHFMAALIPTFRIVQDPASIEDATLANQEMDEFIRVKSRKFNYHAWVREAVKLVEKRKLLKERVARPERQQFQGMQVNVFSFNRSVLDMWLASTQGGSTEE